jgi:hypothetical protein
MDGFGVGTGLRTTAAGDEFDARAGGFADIAVALDEVAGFAGGVPLTVPAAFAAEAWASADDGASQSPALRNITDATPPSRTPATITPASERAPCALGSAERL